MADDCQRKLSATLIGQLGISVWSRSASAAGQIKVN
jgi:hypothetical protein